MNIIAKSANITSPMDMYSLTKAPEREKLSNAAGQILQLNQWLVYSEQNAKGEEVTLISLTTQDGKAYTSNSGTFIRDFTAAVTMFAEFGAEFHTIQVTDGKSKNGRSFITCKVIE